MAKPRNSGSVFQRGRIYWIKYYKDGRPFRESSESEIRDDAERLLKRRLGDIVTGKFAGLGPERILFRELTEGVIDDYLINGRSTVDDVKQRLRDHLLPALGHIRAAEFGSGQLKRYIAERQKQGAARATINRELAIVKRAFRLAAQNDPPLVNRVPHVPTLRENNVRKGFLEHEDYRRLRDALPEPIRPLLVVGYHTGARVGELLPLQWSQVDLAAKRIRLNPGETKNDEGRVLPIYGEMVEWLAMQKSIREEKFPSCKFVFHRSGKRISSIFKNWRDARIACDLERLIFHDLRRTAIRNMIRAGISEKIAMVISGHKTRSVFDRYNIVNDRDLTEAASKMEAHLPATGTVTGTAAKNETATTKAAASANHLN
jgi:integrase